jgi:hypothetical protein
VRAAIKNSGLTMHGGRVTVNLAPADLRKAGPSYDLPIALGVLAATGQIPHLQRGRYAPLRYTAHPPAAFSRSPSHDQPIDCKLIFCTSTASCDPTSSRSNSK